jgi:putative intracellular protease/amidase
MVLTSHAELGTTGHETGFWLEEFGAPYDVFRDAGATLTSASPLGSQPPLDPKSDDAASQTTATRRCKSDAVAQSELSATVKLSALTANSFDAVLTQGALVTCGIWQRTPRRSPWSTR